MESRILNLLKEGHSFEEIEQILNLSNKEMKSILENINKEIRNHYSHIKYYENGKRGFSKEEILESGVITEKNSDYYKSVVISDTHFGNHKEDMSLLNKVYDYCIQSNIHNIYHLGDLVDGTTGPDEKELNSKEQIEHVVLDYPIENNILNFILLGNHDLDTINEDLTLHDAIMKNRRDMMCLGYGTNEFHIKNDKMILKHSILIDKTDNNYSGKLIFKGHSHQMKFVDELDNYKIFVPSLSNLQFVDGTVPGFLLLELGFHNGFINECVTTHYGVIDNKLINMNKIKVNLKCHRKEDYINREESFVKIKR